MSTLKRIGFLLSVVLFIAFIILSFWDRVRNVSVEQDTAALIFTAATVQIGIALTVLFKIWHTFLQLGTNIPTGQRRLRLNLRDVKDSEARERYIMLLMIGLPMILLILCIVAHIFALIIIGNIMLRLTSVSAADEVENFRWGVFFAFWGLGFFTLSFLAAGIAYGSEAAKFMAGKKSLIFPHRTDALIDEHQVKKKLSKWEIGIFTLIIVAIVIAGIWISGPDYGQMKGQPSCNGTMFSIKNVNSRDWANVNMTVNGVYSTRVDRIAAGANYSLPFSDFAKSDGTRLDPASIKILKFVITASHFQDGEVDFDKMIECKALH